MRIHSVHSTGKSHGAGDTCRLKRHPTVFSLQKKGTKRNTAHDMIDNKQSILINVESSSFFPILRVATPIYQISEEKFTLKKSSLLFLRLKKKES